MTLAQILAIVFIIGSFFWAYSKREMSAQLLAIWAIAVYFAFGGVGGLIIPLR